MQVLSSEALSAPNGVYANASQTMPWLKDGKKGREGTGEEGGMEGRKEGSGGNGMLHTQLKFSKFSAYDCHTTISRNLSILPISIYSKALCSNLEKIRHQSLHGFFSERHV